MKTLFLATNETYDGTQLRSLFAYLGHGLLGDSAVAWIGPCSIPFTHMIDGEDLRAGAEIRGGRMLHFIIEVFDRDLFAGVAVQRLMASLAKDLIEARVSGSRASMPLRREGDDVYSGERKLSISIAARSPISTLVHFAMNVENAGTPVATCALREDFGLNAEEIARDLLASLAREYESMLEATRKARPAP